jgi:effector-binding domain-containing protein
MEIFEKPLPAVRLAAHITHVAEQAQVADVVGPMFGAVAAALRDDVRRLPVAEYDMSDTGLEVTVGYEYDGEPRDAFEIVELPPVAVAVCCVHRGTMDTIDKSWEALFDESIARGYIPSGPCREVYLEDESDDQSDWVTELQQPVARL